MAPAFSKEAILQGSVDHLCLACESYLRSDRDLSQHVCSAGHMRNLAGTHYVDKYANHRIRKVKKWYYCEFCNVLVSTITKVRLHVEDSKHKTNVSQMIARVDDVILSGNLEISEDAWHGFIDDNTCIICNVEFEDREEHKNESSHIINLIQSKVSHDSNNCYRKIDETTFHCLTCNTIVAEIQQHLSDTNHKNQIQKCNKANPLVLEENCKQQTIPEICSSQSINKTDVNGDKNNLIGNASNSCEVAKISVSEIPQESQGDVMTDKQSPIQNNNDIKVENKYTSDILDSIPKFQKEHIDINLESRTAVCRKCSVNLEIDSKVIQNHIKQHEVTKKEKVAAPAVVEKDGKKLKNSETLFTSPVSHSKNTAKVETKPKETTKHKQDTIQTLAEEHDLTCLDNKIFCQRCNRHIPFSIRNVMEHINGDLHKINTSLLNKDKATNLKDTENKKVNVKKPKLQKVHIHQFIRTATTIKNMFSEDVVINDKFCVTVLAFTFLTMTSPGKLRCLVCEENVMLPNMKDHLDLTRHDRAMNEIPVVIYNDSEFIREIRSDAFHCGFCNIVDSWEGMENHIKSTSHKECKNFANWRVVQHLPLIHQHNMQRQIQNEFLTRLMFS